MYQHEWVNSIFQSILVLEVKDAHIPINLGQAVLKTINVIIGIKNNKLAFEIKKEKVEFDIFKLTTQSPLLILVTR